MAQAGVDTQVLSLTTPGLQNLDARAAEHLQQSVNDRIAEAVRERPDRYEGLAALATASPNQAAREVERAVRDLGLSGVMLYGRARDKNLDHPELLPVWEVAADLQVPIHLHPQSPVQAVRAAYYDGFGDASAAFSTHSLGWHYETGVQLLRLILFGVFDRFPELQVIVGHWGEVVLSYLDRVEHPTVAAKPPRPIRDYVRHHVFLAPSGMLNPTSLTTAIELAGPEQVMFSTDYPFETDADQGAGRFLAEAPITEKDRELVASGNWCRLTAAIHR